MKSIEHAQNMHRHTHTHAHWSDVGHDRKLYYYHRRYYLTRQQNYVVLSTYFSQFSFFVSYINLHVKWIPIRLKNTSCQYTTWQVCMMYVYRAGAIYLQTKHTKKALESWLERLFSVLQAHEISLYYVLFKWKCIIYFRAFQHDSIEINRWQCRIVENRYG